MLWPLVLPFRLTAVGLAACTVMVTVIAALLRRRPLRTFVICLLLSLVSFIPICSVIMSRIDGQRFGTFKYSSFDEVDDFRVERYLPRAATNITVDKQASGYRAKFHITNEELNDFLDGHWKRYGDWSAVPRGELSTSNPADPKTHHRQFGDLGWAIMNDATERFGPSAPNGAGFSVWYSPTSEIAYQRGYYW